VQNCTADQWVLCFFFYCLCGWIWESCYVSVRQHRWVNRGFLHGPLLPIYGSGAIIVLLATLRVQSNLALVYLFGMISATVLEYFTGAAMEALFHVRYWDYTNQKCNLKGYICLSSTLAWGVFSIVLVRVLQPPVARVLLLIPQSWGEPLAFALVAVTTGDAVQSFRAAMDLREMLAKLTEENEELRRLAKRAEVLSAFAEEDLKAFRDRTEVEKILLQDRLESGRARLQEVRAQRAVQRREELEQENIRQRSSARLRALRGISETLEAYRGRLGESRELAGEALESRKAEIAESLEKLRTLEARVRTRTAGSYRQSLRILRGNPSASAKKYAEAMESLRGLGGMKRD